MTDEVSHVSNHDQLVICIHWIYQESQPPEDIIGFYHVKNFKSGTLFTSIQDALRQMNSR